jgi:signal peptidase I
MDVDFPLILTWAVIITGGIWLVDIVVLKPRREAALESLTASRGGSGVAAGGTATAADAVAEDLGREPILVEYARSFFPVLLIVLVLRSFLVEPYQIPSESMVPTLQVGDFILVNKFSYGIRLPVLGTKVFDVGDPQRGDVMVFIPPHESRYFIKRVIGLPGDVIRYQNKTLYINGERIPQAFVDETSVGDRLDFRVYTEQLGEREHLIHRYPRFRHRPNEWVVPDGHYFMMGDNRDRSDDSRRWGFVPDSNVVGKAFAVWIHKDPGLNWPTFERNGLIE